MKCQQCQFDNDPGSKFCGNCGGGLEQAEPAPTPQPAAQTKTVVCLRCNTGNSVDSVFCKTCGTRLGSDPLPPAASPQTPRQQTSPAWWLLPLFLTWVGGLIGYLVVKDSDPSKAKGLLIFGIVWTIVLVIVSIIASIVLNLAVSY